MRKVLFALFAALFSVTIAEAVDETDVTLATAFHLNPITGINGDENEASSKFVQRMIFSPLVFPLQDPYLEDDYSIALDLSMINETIEYYHTGSRIWRSADLRSNDSGSTPTSTRFRVMLREGLNFYKGDNRRVYSPLGPDDVVYSYRLARITIDRAYRAYLASSTSAKLGINTLLYSKIKSFEDVYVDSDGAVIFETENEKTCEEFAKLLVYVQILSLKQVRGLDSKSKNYKNSEIVKALGFSMKMSGLNKNIDSKKYDDYDLNWLLVNYRNISRDFFNQPVGYGQFLVKRTVSKSGGEKTEDVFTRIELSRNKNWCENFNSNYKLIGARRLRHDSYSSHDYRLAVTTVEGDPAQRLLNLSADGVLYNIPLSANLFANQDELRNNTENKAKRKMQISHSLYGIYFGPSINNWKQPQLPHIRRFFGEFADRVRVENTVKYITGETNTEQFDSYIRQSETNLIADIQIQKLYYPFYSGGDYYDSLRSKDYVYQLFSDETEGKTLRQKYLELAREHQTAEGDSFYNLFIGGNTYTGSLKQQILTRYNSPNDVVKVKDSIITPNGIKIQILHLSNDKIGKTIALHYRDTLRSFFRERAREENWNFSNDDIITQEITNYALWYEIAATNAKSKTLSFLVKGWNYKFDLLDELRDQFIDKNSMTRIRGFYRELIESRGGLDAKTIYERIAEEFVNNTVMIPLVGVQNYAVYRTGNFPAFDGNPDIEVLLLPYYWRGN
jgi:hypothetical protein